MKVYEHPLTSEESEACIENDRLTAVIKMPFDEIVDAEDIDGFEELIDEFFPGRSLVDIHADVVGFESGGKEDRSRIKGFVYIKVRGDVS